MFTKMVMELVDKLEQGVISPDMRSSGVKSEEGSRPGVKVGETPTKSKGCCKR